MPHGIYEWQYIITMVLAFLVALTVHEYAHARAALAAGDDTAERAGRVSLNPFDHLDPIGTLMFVFMIKSGFGIAWGKPVPVDPSRFRNPRWDSLRVSLWGPLANFITAFALAVIMRGIVAPYAPEYLQLMRACILLNLGLAFFNLLPIPPLDGSSILSSLLPAGAARRYDYTMGRYGIIILLVVVVTGLAGRVIGPPVLIMYRVLTGLG